MGHNHMSAVVRNGSARRVLPLDPLVVNDPKIPNCKVTFILVAIFMIHRGKAYSCRFTCPYVRMSVRPHLAPNTTTKLQEFSTRNFVDRYISMSRSAVHKNHNSALPTFGTIALCSFLHFDFYPGHNSETTRTIYKKLCR